MASGIVEAVKVLLKLLLLFFTSRLAQDKIKKEKAKNVLKTLNEGLKENDPSKLTSAFDAITRM